MEDLVVRARDGDREAFASLVQPTSDRLYAIATRILRDGDLAEDALQGALVTAWRHLPTLRDPARFEACAPLVKPGTGGSVDELISHVTQHPGPTASAPQPITIGGQAG